MNNVDSSKKIVLVFECDNVSMFSQSVLYHNHIYLDMISNGYGHSDMYYSGSEDVYHDLIELVMVI